MKLTTVRFQKLAQSSKGNRFSVVGVVLVKAEIIEEGLRVGHSTGKTVRLTESGAGYPVGHVITVSDGECAA